MLHVRVQRHRQCLLARFHGHGQRIVCLGGDLIVALRLRRRILYRHLVGAGNRILLLIPVLRILSARQRREGQSLPEVAQLHGFRADGHIGLTEQRKQLVRRLAELRLDACRHGVHRLRRDLPGDVIRKCERVILRALGGKRQVALRDRLGVGVRGAERHRAGQLCRMLAFQISGHIVGTCKRVRDLVAAILEDLAGLRRHGDLARRDRAGKRRLGRAVDLIIADKAVCSLQQAAVHAERDVVAHILA